MTIAQPSNAHNNYAVVNLLWSSWLCNSISHFIYVFLFSSFLCSLFWIFFTSKISSMSKISNSIFNLLSLPINSHPHRVMVFLLLLLLLFMKTIRLYSVCRSHKSDKEIEARLSNIKRPTKILQFNIFKSRTHHTNKKKNGRK